MSRAKKSRVRERLSYEEAAEAIDGVAEAKARKVKNIGWLDEEDIKQEVRLKCFLILDRYDPSMSDLTTFLSRCADNRLRDIRRSIVYKHNKPCFRCPLWDRAAAVEGRHDCAGFSNKMECDKFAKHEQYVQAKISASRPVNIDDANVEDGTFDDVVENAEMIEYVRSKLAPPLLPFLDALVRSNFNPSSVSPRNRMLLFEAVVEVLQVHREEMLDE